jgi:hypothetical protein
MLGSVLLTSTGMPVIKYSGKELHFCSSWRVNGPPVGLSEIWLDGFRDFGVEKVCRGQWT